MSGASEFGRRLRTEVWAKLATVRAVVVLAHERNLTYMAAGIAYYAFVSVIPLLLLAVVVASVVGGEALAGQVTRALSRQLTASGQQAVADLLTDTAGRGAASVVGVVALTWSGLKLFRGLDQGFDELYPEGVDTPFLQQLRDAALAVVGLGTAAVCIVAVGVALSVLEIRVPSGNVLGPLALAVVLVLAFLPMYYVFPPVEVSVRGVLPGTVVAAVGWVLLQSVFQVYASTAGRYGAYGVLGALLLFVTWLYFASIVLLLGAAVNAVRQGAGSAPGRPDR